MEYELNLHKSLYKLIDKSYIVRFLWKNIEGWKTEYVSKNVESIFEYTENDFILNKISYEDIIHPEDLTRVKNEVVYNSKQNKDSFNHLPYRIITKSGKIKWIKDTTIIIRNDNNEITNFHGLISDITNEKKNIDKLKKLNEKLTESEKRYKTLCNLTFESIILYKNGKVIDVNQSFIKLFGYNKDELLGVGFIDLIIPKKYHNLLFSKNNIEHTELYDIEIITKNGKIIPVEIESKLIKLNEEEFRVVAVRDISVRKKNQKEITKLLTAVEQSANTVVITDVNGNIEYTNPKFTEITGYTKNEALGENLRILKTGFTNNETYKKLWQTITEGEIWKGEFENVTKCGVFFTENVTITPIKNEHNEIVNFLAIKEDITEKKENEKKLLKNEKRFKLLSESTFESIFIIENNIITDVNNAALLLTQYSYNELIGLHPLFFIDKAYRSIAIKNLLSTSDVLYESIGIRKDGTKINIEIQTKVIKEGNKTYRIITVRDITERTKINKLLELEKNNSFSKIIEVQEKEKYELSKLLHDGLGPELSSLRLHFEALKNSNNKTETKRIIQKSFSIIETITEGIRDVSKILSPHLLKDFGLYVAINNYLESILCSIGIKFTSNIENLKFENEIEIAIYRIFQELITNTMKHSRAKNINIEINIKKHILLCMYSDNGIGFNINTVMKNPNKGIGLRNIISRIEYIKGNYKMESNNKGFFINIEVPIK